MRREGNGDDKVEILQEEQKDERWKTKGRGQRKSENWPRRVFQSSGKRLWSRGRPSWDQVMGIPQDRKFPGAAR